jgi:hypothetical protein
VDRSERELLGCDCNSVAAFGRCARRVSDGSLWAVRASDEAVAGELARCSFEESDRVTHACEFAHCEHPPLSTCSLEATCADRGCDNPLYFADGCRRAPCSTDDECDAGERCVALDCVVDSACTVSDPGPDETCGCAGPAGCRPGGACNPVAPVRPTETWQKLQLFDGPASCVCGDEPCRCSDPSVCCLQVWEVRPSGQFRAGWFVHLENLEFGNGDLGWSDGFFELNMEAINAIIDGPNLRDEMRAGFACQRDGPPTVNRTSLIRLTVDGETLEQPTDRCASPPNNDFSRLLDLLTHPL